MKSLTFLSLLAVTALAQQQQSSASSPLIPNGISAECKVALEKFDSDPSLQGCTSGVIKATREFASGGATVTEAGMKSALDVLCAAPTCSESTVRTILAQFYQSCAVELTSSPNTEVVTLYEVIYTLSPFLDSVCTKDDSNNYCALQIPARINGTNKSTPAGVKTNLVSAGLSPYEAKDYLGITHTLSRRAPGDTSYALVNETTFRTTNLLFQFLTPNLDSSVLCTSCTRNIMTAYIEFESNVPYAPSKEQSQLLSGQNALYNGIQATCGKSFLSGAVQAAGGLGAGGPFGATSGALSSFATSGSLSLGLGAVTLFLAAFL